MTKKDTLITKKSLIIALRCAYKFGRDNAARRSEANFNDFISTKLAQDILSKTYQNDITKSTIKND